YASCMCGTAPPAPYSRSLHDALPILGLPVEEAAMATSESAARGTVDASPPLPDAPGFEHRVVATPGLRTHLAVIGEGEPVVLLRSEEHTSELQSRENLVCRLLLEKKK